MYCAHERETIHVNLELLSSYSVELAIEDKLGDCISKALYS